MCFPLLLLNTQEAWEIGETDDEDSDVDNEIDGMMLDSGYTNEVDDLNNPGLSDDDQASLEFINSDQETDVDSVMMVRNSLLFFNQWFSFLILPDHGYCVKAREVAPLGAICSQQLYDYYELFIIECWKIEYNRMLNLVRTEENFK